MDITEVKKGMTVIIEGVAYQIIDFLHVKPGKGAAFMQTRIKNIKTGATLDRNYNTNMKCEEANIKKVAVQYLYNDTEKWYFMDNETYEQFELTADQVGDNKNYLIENNEVSIITLDGELIELRVPEKLQIKVVEVDQVAKSSNSNSSNASMDATLETGMVIKVPLFINEGEVIVITTADGKYYSRT